MAGRYRVTAPAARLLAAADLLDKRASEATEGPWQSLAWTTVSGELRAAVAGDPQTGNYRTPDGKGWTEVARGDADCAGPGPYLMQSDAAYIATMHPEVGKALAKVLRTEAKRLKRTELMLAFGGAPLFKPEPDTLALADLLLAGGS